MNPSSKAAELVETITADASLPVRLDGHFDHEQDYRYEGSLAVGDDTFDLRLENFNPGFAIMQTMRDVQGAGLPNHLGEYKRDAEAPISLTVAGDRVLIDRGVQPEAQLLLLLGRLITNNTP